MGIQEGVMVNFINQTLAQTHITVKAFLDEIDI